MEISATGAMALQNHAMSQSKDIAILKKGMDMQQTMATQLLDGMTKGGVDTSAPRGSQVNIIA